ncbi:MAG TPA: aminotransferase class I/II-fold pyridoxal phosphate-dependent enzyme [Pirellulales bacterium]|jgi:alanine-synthesizing transaminase|nr:aminotransferase class I/II-fold pyridoxal phosphate-dependent enzyme [Pirellulales bacterium]
MSHAEEKPEPVDDLRPFQIQLAERMKRLPAYLFARLNQLMYQKRRAGDDVVDMGMGNPTDPPADLIIEKLAEAAHDSKNHGYSPSLGIMQLRREVASRYLKKWGVRLDPESELIVTLGSKEGFSHLCLALIGPGDTAIVPAPTYPAHMYAVSLASGNAITLEVADSDKFLSNVAYICQHIEPRPKMVILNYPHNPSTVTIDPPFYVEAVKLARKYGFILISDLAYADVCFDGYQAPSLLSVPGAKEVAVEFTTMSKGFSMAGWRIGYCAGNAEIIRALGTIKAYYDYGMFRPMQIAAIMALRHCESAVEAQAKEYQHRRDVLCEGLNRIGWNVTPPRASMFVWAKIPEPWAKMGSLDFAMKLLEEADVVVSPGAGFGPAGEGYLRMALVENDNRIRQAVRNIGRTLGSDPKPGGSSHPASVSGRQTPAQA